MFPFQPLLQTPVFPAPRRHSLHCLIQPSIFPQKPVFLTAEALSTVHLVIHLPKCDHRSQVVGTALLGC